MLRDIPCRYQQDELVSILNDLGLKDKYNFLYLPMDVRVRNKKAANRGYAFINLKGRRVMSPALFNRFTSAPHFS